MLATFMHAATFAGAIVVVGVVICFLVLSGLVVSLGFEDLDRV
jgi:hypothetical protein